MATTEQGPTKLSGLARLMEVSHECAQRWARDGRTPTLRTPGGRWRVPAGAARKLLEPRGDASRVPACPEERWQQCAPATAPDEQSVEPDEGTAMAWRFEVLGPRGRSASCG